MIERDLRDYMLADSGISAKVGTRIHLTQLPELATYPAIAFQQISGPREHTLGDGYPTAATPRYQISCFAITYAAVKELVLAVEAAFDGHLGELVPSSPIQGTFVLDVHDTFEPIPRVFMCPVDVMLFFNPPAGPVPGGNVTIWQRYTIGDGLTGAINGVNQIYTVPVTPDPRTAIVVFNGLVVLKSRYTINGSQFVLSFAPKAADGDFAADTLEVYC